MAIETIGTNKVVSIHYTLTNDSQEVLDSSEGAEPLVYLHGHGTIVPGLENGLEGHKVGDRVQVTVPPELGYGEASDVGLQPVPRGQFPAHLELVPGMQFFTEGPNEEVMPVWIDHVEEDTVFLSIDHPLAGVTLHFDVTVAELRDATEEELEHGHPHGADGHHHHDDDDHHHH